MKKESVLLLTHAEQMHFDSLLTFLEVQYQYEVVAPLFPACTKTTQIF